MTKLYILCGIPFSGKSTLAKALADQLSGVRIDLDDIKFEMYGINVTDDELKQEDWDQIYQKMYGLIEKSLVGGNTVVHDTGNFTKYERQLISNIAQKLDLDFVTIFVDTPIEVARQRLLQNRQTLERFDVSDKAFEEAVLEMEKPTKEENSIVFNSNDDLISLIKVNNVTTNELRLLFTFGTLYPDDMIQALLGEIPENFYGTLEGYSMYSGNYAQLSRQLQEDFADKILDKGTFVYVFAKEDPNSNFVIEGRAYYIDSKQELILDHWERYPNWYRKQNVVIKDNDGKQYDAFIYTLDIDGVKMTEYKRVMNDPEKALENARKMREIVISKFPDIFNNSDP